jgi:histidinol phosphatase-like enzyme
MKKIWLDMDGTIADLYSVDGWLEMLRAEDATPYAIAKPLLNMNVLARLIHKAQRKGFQVCIVSALAKDSTEAYDEKVKTAKEKWLKKHLASVKFDEIRFVPYWFKKNDVNTGNDIFFDDEERHLTAWTGKAYHASEILSTLRAIA